MNTISKKTVLMEKSAVRVIRKGDSRGAAGVISKEDVGSGKIDVS